MMRKQARTVTASNGTPTKAPSSKSTGQFTDKARQLSNGELGSHHLSDRQRLNGSANKNVLTSQTRAGNLRPTTVDKNTQLSSNFKLANFCASRANEKVHQNPVGSVPSSKRPTECLSAKSSSKVREREVRGHRSSRIHRAEGVFDLSSLHLGIDHCGSVANLLEEFKKQTFILESPASTCKSRSGRDDFGKATASTSHVEESAYHTSVASANRIAVPPSEPVRRDNYHHKMDSHNAQGFGYLTKTRNCSKEITGSEEELLKQILVQMSSSSSVNETLGEDESDYANLWDSESGLSSTFQTNKDVMGSLMRKKVHNRVSSEDPRRNACTISDTQSADLFSDGHPQFDMDKFKSLQEKAENMDLTLTDFFADLKHSSSILELSKISSSTLNLSPKDCKFKCHTGCEDVIQNSCPGPEADKRHEDDDMWTHRKTHQDVDDTDSGYSGSGGSAGFTLTKEEICSKIQAYNKSVGLASGAMTLPATDSDSFKGNIKVCVCITRPINMSLSSRPTSIYEALHREAELSPQASPSNTVVTHEQIPQNAVVSLHTDSCDTAIEVVSILLNKFKITDNPKSFALFEQTIQNEKEVKLRKVGDQERPLLNYLRWITESNESKRFVLKENDSGDIMYEAFSIPELNNFLRVLEHEEAERLTEIQNKYLVRRKQLSDRLRELQPEKNSNSKTVR
ncbi:uncharacterized protein [Watersipora subatra]|uniref:uncharacterized protein isoform X1 n=1 Tax=Watersipora subatra TaxID=2589382 RepID=UPI00355B7019